MRIAAIITVVIAVAVAVSVSVAYLLRGPLPGDVFRECPECPEMVVVSAGQFEMGSPRSEAGRDADEGPQHMVSIPAPFAVGKFEITFAEWDACVAAGGCGGYSPDDAGWGRGTRPVMNVGWDDVQSYIQWLNSIVPDGAYRLLTEAEWEYAARAGTTTRYSWGDAIGRGNANCLGSDCGDDFENTAPVGSFRANGFGLHDMHGNVWEWVEDCYNEQASPPDYTGAPVGGEAWLTGGDCSPELGTQPRRVLRGGSWNYFPEHARSANRGRHSTEYRVYNHFGFRVARTL